MKDYISLYASFWLSVGMIVGIVVKKAMRSYKLNQVGPLIDDWNKVRIVGKPIRSFLKFNLVSVVFLPPSTCGSDPDRRSNATRLRLCPFAADQSVPRRPHDGDIQLWAWSRDDGQCRSVRDAQSHGQQELQEVGERA